MIWECFTVAYIAAYIAGIGGTGYGVMKDVRASCCAILSQSFGSAAQVSARPSMIAWRRWKVLVGFGTRFQRVGSGQGA
jgi:hypothetical protein